jgi:uncharacterized protein (DUF4415 family)
MKSKQPDREIPSNTKIRLRLDSDVVEYFKTMDNYEDLINDILRRHVEERTKQVS